MAKGIYVGGPKSSWELVWITPTNINEYFIVSNSTAYTFVGSGNVYDANNLGVNSSTATMKLTLKQDIGGLQCAYMYTTEQNYDKFYIYKNGTAVVNGVSGVTSSPEIFNSNGAMKAGEYIEFKYTKDGSSHAANETCYFQALAITIRGEEDVTNGVARKVSTGYVGVGGIARTLTRGYVGVGGVAREFFGNSGVKWEKFDCTEKTNNPHWVEITPSGDILTLDHMANNTTYITQCSTNYHFTPTGSQPYACYVDEYFSFHARDLMSEAIVRQNFIGRYASNGINHRCLVQDVLNYQYDASTETVTFNTLAKEVAKASVDYYYTTYQKGNTFYNSIQKQEGVLPEEGTLIEGSAYSSYCILEINGTKYYYTKTEL